MPTRRVQSSAYKAFQDTALPGKLVNKSPCQYFLIFPFCGSVTTCGRRCTLERMCSRRTTRYNTVQLCFTFWQGLLFTSFPGTVVRLHVAYNGWNKLYLKSGNTKGSTIFFNQLCPQPVHDHNVNLSNLASAMVGFGSQSALGKNCA